MLVKHLIRELQKVNPEFQVLTEGCDCFGESAYVAIDATDKSISIMRDSSFGRNYNNYEDTKLPLVVPDNNRMIKLSVEEMSGYNLT